MRFKEGDRVQRRRDSNPWHSLPKQRGPGTVSAVVETGMPVHRINVQFDNGEVAEGWEAAFFELAPPFPRSE